MQALARGVVVMPAVYTATGAALVAMTIAAGVFPLLAQLARAWSSRRAQGPLEAL